MTDQELKKLKRQDLLRLLLEMEKENKRLRRELTQAREQLESRQIAISEAGSLAEAALKLSGVFEDAQHAADVYLQNVEEFCRQQAARSKETAEGQAALTGSMIASTERKCREMEEACRVHCEEIKAEAIEWASDYKESVRRQIMAYLSRNPSLRDGMVTNERERTDPADA